MGERRQMAQFARSLSSQSKWLIRVLVPHLDLPLFAFHPCDVRQQFFDTSLQLTDIPPVTREVS